MFEAPEIIIKIPEIEQIYKVNDKQIKRLNNAVSQLNEDLFFEDMGEDRINRWERILNIIPQDNDTIQDRRFRIQSRIIERLPYSYRLMVKKINMLCFENTIERQDKHIIVKVALTSAKKTDEINEMLDIILPLNLTFHVQVLYNTYQKLSKLKHFDMERYTYKGLRECDMEV